MKAAFKDPERLLSHISSCFINISYDSKCPYNGNGFNLQPGRQS